MCVFVQRTHVVRRRRMDENVDARGGHLDILRDPSELRSLREVKYEPNDSWVGVLPLVKAKYFPAVL